MLFATTQMDLEIIIVSEVSQTEINSMISHNMECTKIIQINLFTNRLTDLEYKLTVTKVGSVQAGGW